MNKNYKISKFFDKIVFMYISYGELKFFIILHYILGMLNINYCIHKDFGFPFYEAHYLVFAFRKWHPIIFLYNNFISSEPLGEFWLNIPKIHEIGLDDNDKIIITNFNRYKFLGS